jgi:hypothetical protein
VAIPTLAPSPSYFLQNPQSLGEYAREGCPVEMGVHLVLFDDPVY